MPNSYKTISTLCNSKSSVEKAISRQAKLGVLSVDLLPGAIELRVSGEVAEEGSSFAVTKTALQN